MLEINVYYLVKLLGSRALSKDLKIQLNITLIHPKLTYGAKTCMVRKILQIYDPVIDMLSVKWRIRKNVELKIPYHKFSILSIQLQWAEHAWHSLMDSTGRKPY